MPNILIRNVSQRGRLSHLKALAKQHNRSLHGEVKHLVEESVKMTGEAALLRTRKIRASFGRKIFSNSAELLHEERDG